MAIDSVVRGAFLRAIARVLPSSRGHDAALARRVLVLRHDRIGDMLMTTGLLRALKEARPALEIDVAASESNASVLGRHPAVRRVHVVRSGLGGARAARRTFVPEHYDAVIDALVLKPSVNTSTMLLLWASGAPIRVGIGGRPNDVLYTHRVLPPGDTAHHVEYLAALLRPFGIDPACVDVTPDLTVQSEERATAEAYWATVPGSGARLLVNISAGKHWCRWPNERFAEVLAGVREARPELRIVVTGLPHERESYEALAAAVHGRALSGSLREALAIVATADVVFTPDTSIAHAAAATAKPAVVMLPAVTSPRFLPYHSLGISLYAEGDTLDALEVGPVERALAQVLDQVALR